MTIGMNIINRKTKNDSANIQIGLVRKYLIDKSKEERFQQKLLICKSLPIINEMWLENELEKEGSNHILNLNQ